VPGGGSALILPRMNNYRRSAFEIQGFLTAAPGSTPEEPIVADGFRTRSPDPSSARSSIRPRATPLPHALQRRRKAYAKQWRAFEAWCAQQGLCALPAAPQNVALYLAGLHLVRTARWQALKSEPRHASAACRRVRVLLAWRRGSWAILAWS
jgi:hypothetical protein